MLHGILSSHAVCTYAYKNCLPIVAAPRKAPGEVFDTYLGMLYPTEDYKVYGYISNTRIKFILVVDEMLQKEDEVRMVTLSVRVTLLFRAQKLVAQLMPMHTWPATGRISKSCSILRAATQRSWCLMQVFKRFHTAYVDAVSNPFYTTSKVRRPVA